MKRLDVVDVIAAEQAASRWHDYDEPYRGVSALFNADLHAGMPEYADRDEWFVLAPGILQRRGHVLIKDRYYPTDTSEVEEHLAKDERIAAAYKEIEDLLRF